MDQLWGRGAADLNLKALLAPLIQCRGQQVTQLLIVELQHVHLEGRDSIASLQLAQYWQLLRRLQASRTSRLS